MRTSCGLHRTIPAPVPSGDPAQLVSTSGNDPAIWDIPAGAEALGITLGLRGEPNGLGLSVVGSMVRTVVVSLTEADRFGPHIAVPSCQHQVAIARDQAESKVLTETTTQGMLLPPAVTPEVSSWATMLPLRPSSASRKVLSIRQGTLLDLSADDPATAALVM
jgi:hypothetical protein